MFRSTSNKILGFIVARQGIKIDLSKLKDITEMSASTIEIEVTGFLGHLNYICRFIAQLVTICEPLFKLLKKNKEVVWDDCHRAFEKI